MSTQQNNQTEDWLDINRHGFGLAMSLIKLGQYFALGILALSMAGGSLVMLFGLLTFMQGGGLYVVMGLSMILICWLIFALFVAVHWHLRSIADKAQRQRVQR